MLDGEMDFDFAKKGFHLTVRQYIDEEKEQTVSVFNISINRRKLNLTANLTHVVRN